MKSKSMFICLALMLASSLFAQTARDVIEKYKNLDVPPYSTGTLIFDNFSPNGQQTKHLELKQYGKIFKNDEINTVFEFTAPADTKNLRILQSEKIGKTDENMVYMPKLRNVRRIPLADRNASVAGTELTYHDMRLRDINDDHHEMLNANDSIVINNKKFDAFKIKSTPVKKNEVNYSHIIQWIDKDSYLPVTIQYFDKKDKEKLIKTYEITRIEKVKGTTGKEYLLRRECWYKNEINGCKTRVIVKDAVFDAKISDSYFTSNWLATGKAK